MYGHRLSLKLTRTDGMSEIFKEVDRHHFSPRMVRFIVLNQVHRTRRSQSYAGIEPSLQDVFCLLQSAR